MRVKSRFQNGPQFPARRHILVRYTQVGDYKGRSSSFNMNSNAIYCEVLCYLHSFDSISHARKSASPSK